MSLDPRPDFLELAPCLNVSNGQDTNTKDLFDAQLFGACSRWMNSRKMQAPKS